MKTIIMTAAAILAASPVVAQDPDPRELLQAVEEVREARWEGVHAVTMTTLVMGHEVTFRNDFSFPDGERQVDGRVLSVEGPAALSPEDLQEQIPDITGPGRWDRVPAAETRWEGMEGDGRRLHRVVLIEPDLPEEIAPVNQGGELRIETERIILHVDPSRNLIPRITFVGQAVNVETGRRGPVRVTTSEEDYREVDGLFFPGRTSVTMEIPMEVMTPAGLDPAEFASGIRAVRDLLETLPEDERTRMVAMTGPMLDAFRQDGSIQTETLLVDVRVERR